MSDINIRQIGPTGRITFTREKALNAMSYDMCTAIEVALDQWAIDETVKMVLIDAMGDKAFCAGGDIADLYETGTSGNFTFGQTFWADEYRMNAKLREFPKPVASFMQGFTMGGGVGVGCHGSHRVVGDSSQIAMPECGIGLVPDVGGSYILATAPGHLGEYLGLTAARMGPTDAIRAGFADYYIPQDQWPVLVSTLEKTADSTLIETAATTAPTGMLEGLQDKVDRHFGAESLSEIVTSLQSDNSPFATDALKKMRRNSPLAMGCALEIIRRTRVDGDFRAALTQEYRFTYRAMEHGDFLEGIRAQIIDKDRNPQWRHQIDNLPDQAVQQMLLPLGEASLTFHKGD